MKKILIMSFCLSLLLPGCVTNLKVVTVSAPAVNCVFDSSCTISVNDTAATIPLATGGTNFLQSRTFTGSPGSPAQMLNAYEYRIDLSNAIGITDIPCISSLTIEFGPIFSELDYNGDGEPDQVYVVTGGGLGEVGLASATKDNGNVTFKFESPVCVGGSPGTGQSSFFFGLVSTQPPMPLTGTVKEASGAVHDVQVRVPQQ